MKNFKQLKYLLLFIFSFLYFPVYCQQITIELDLKDEIPLEEMIALLEANFGLLFSYKEEDIQAVEVTCPPGKQTIDDFLTIIFRKKGIRHEIVNSNYIILTKTALPYEDDWSLLCGTVLDSFTQNPLAYASVFIKKTQKGISSSSDGSFLLKAQLDGNDTLIISYVGYQEKRLLAKNFIQQPCRKIALNYIDIGEDFVVITEYLTDGISLSNNGYTTELEPNKTGALPGQAEPDVLSTIQFLPGISSTDGTVSGISVRGGTPDQNLILWEDIPIYHSAHYFGMISAFNPYIINKVSVFRGGFDVEYGGRISGVIDMKSDHHNWQEFNFGAGANLLNGYTNGKLSLVDDKLSVIYSVRRSISELWHSPTFKNITKRIQQGVLVQNVDLNQLPDGIRIIDKFNFFDSNIKAAYQLSDKDDCSVAWFYGHNDFKGIIYDDKFLQRQTDTLFLANSGLSLSWKHQWNSSLSTRLLGLFTNYHYDYEYSVVREGEVFPDKFGDKGTMIEEKQVHLLNNYKTRSDHHIKLGYQLVNYDIAYHLSKLNQQNEPIDDGRALQSNLHVVYAAFNTRKDNRFGFDAGLRMSYFEEDKQIYYEPRLRFWYKLNKAFNWYVNAGKYYQFLNQLLEIEGDNASIETPVWALSSEDEKETPVLDATQYQMGLVFRKKSWLIDIQTYLKNIRDISSIASGFDEEIANKFHIGSARIRGIDILLKKRWNNYRSWLSYSISKNEYDFPSFFDPNFLAPIDQRHSFNWTNSYRINDWAFSLGWKIASGRPYSKIDYFEVIVAAPNTLGPKESIRPLFNTFNSERLPMEHQLDASVLYTFRPRKEGGWKGILGLSLYNIYHQRNIYSRTFYIKKPLNGIPTLEYNDKVNLGFTPNMVLRLEW